MVAKVADEALQRYEEAWFNFHRYDTDNSGTIEMDELRGLLVDLKMHVGRSQRTEEQMKQWVERELRRSDTNKDGVLSFEEFLKYYNSFVSRHRSQWDELYKVSEDKTLGKGAFGTVFRGQRVENQEWVAVKRLNKAGIGGDLELLHNEIAIWEDLDHPHLVKLIDVFEDAEHIILITELMHGGDLFERLRRQPHGRYDEGEGAALVWQIVSAVAYLHSLGVVHCDLKPNNVLVVEPLGTPSLTRGGDVPLSLKVADFGLSQTVIKSGGKGHSDRGKGCGSGGGGEGGGGDDGGGDGGDGDTGAGVGIGSSCAGSSRPAHLTSIVGTPAYFAPELVRLAQHDFSATHYDAAVDNWAIGCIAYELLVGRCAPSHVKPAPCLFDRLHKVPAFAPLAVEQLPI